MVYRGLTMRLETMSITPEHFESLVEDLRFRYHKWDAYVGGILRVVPHALVIAPQEHEEAVQSCIRLQGAFERAAARLLDEPAWMDRLGIPGVVQQIARAESPHPYSVVRYDLIPTAMGWMAPEVNEDAPGGFNESIASRPLFGGLLNGSAIAGDFAKCFQDSMPSGKRAGLIYATGYAEDLQHMLILADLLREKGVESVLASPEHLTCRPYGRPRICGEPVDWIFRFFPGEWYAYLDNTRAWCRTAARIPVINPLSRLLRQTKGLYALWREAPLVDEDDTALLNRFTPHTEFFQRERLDFYLTHREEWALKQLFGRMGDTVTIGRLCTQAVWEKAIEEAAKKPEAWIAQHAFSPLPVSNGVHTLFPALGVYLINGAFAGYYSRADELGLTTHEAHYVVTAVETA